MLKLDIFSTFKPLSVFIHYAFVGIFKPFTYHRLLKVLQKSQFLERVEVHVRRAKSCKTNSSAELAVVWSVEQNNIQM